MSIDLIIHDCSQLVTLSGPAGPRRGLDQGELGIITRGAVAVADGKILATGPEDEIASFATSSTKFLSAHGGVVTPGLIDPHTHLPFAGTREHEFEMRALGKTYAGIMASGMGIYATVKATHEADEHRIFTGARGYLQRMVQSGTTTVEIKSGYGLDIETELKQLSVVKPLMDAIPVDIVATYLGAHAVPKCESPMAYVEFLCHEALPAVARQGIAAFCDVFCETGVFTPELSERILCAAQKLGLRSKIHADELTDTGGAALAAKVGAISADHLHCASEAGLRAMAAAGTVAVLLPGTAIFLGLAHHAPARRMIELGIPVAIATDFNPGSCFCESLPLMMTFACSQLGLSPAEALTAVTINAACAIGMDGVVGSLTPGKQADFVIWDADNYHMIPYHMGANLARTVIKRGQIIHGRTH